MCELFAMSSRIPTAVTYSLDEFSKYGSRIRHNRDGWGIALGNRGQGGTKVAHAADATCKSSTATTHLR